jgi:FkbM family methyltransferase
MLSQHGEDQYALLAFGNYCGHAVDVGASDGVSLSNTYFFEIMGWSVLCVEPSEVFREQLIKSRKLVRTVAAGAKDSDDAEFSVYGPVGGFAAGSSLSPDPAIVASVEGLSLHSKQRVQVRTLDRLLEEAGFHKCEYASIDTEGTEADVLKGFDTDRWGTKMIIVENNFETDDTRSILRARGFTFKRRMGVNDLWEKR